MGMFWGVFLFWGVFNGFGIVEFFMHPELFGRMFWVFSELFGHSECIPEVIMFPSRLGDPNILLVCVFFAE